MSRHTHSVKLKHVGKLWCICGVSEPRPFCAEAAAMLGRSGVMELLILLESVMI